MYYCVSQIKLQSEAATSQDAKLLSSLCQKLRKRFSVSCTANISDKSGYSISIYLSYFSNTEMQVGQKLDKILEYIEEQGLGRVEGENYLIDHVDTISNE